jgi:hypothetical protein
MSYKIIITESQLKKIISEASYNVNWSKYPCVTTNKGLTQSKDSQGNIIYVNKKDGTTYYGNGQLVVPGFLGSSYSFSCIGGKISSDGIKGSSPSDEFLKNSGKKDSDRWKNPDFSCVLKQQGLKSMVLNDGSVAYVFNNTRYYSNGLKKTNSSGDGVVGYYKCINGKPTESQKPKKNQTKTDGVVNGGELKNVIIPPKSNVLPKQKNNLLVQKTKQIQKMVGMGNQTGTFGNVTLGKVIDKMRNTLSEQDSKIIEPPIQGLTPVDTTMDYGTKDSQLKTNVNIVAPSSASLNPIKDLQTLLNTKYNSGLAVDGKYGIKTADAIIKALGSKPISENKITQIMNKFKNYIK